MLSGQNLSALAARISSSSFDFGTRPPLPAPLLGMLSWVATGTSFKQISPSQMCMCDMLFGVSKAPLYCFQIQMFVWFHVCVYVYIYIYRSLKNKYLHKSISQMEELHIQGVWQPKVPANQHSSASRRFGYIALNSRHFGYVFTIRTSGNIFALPTISSNTMPAFIHCCCN